MEESGDNMSADESKSDAVKMKPKKRSLVERELETSLTARVTSPITSADGTTTSRYGRARRLKTDTDFCDTERAVSNALKSPLLVKTPVKSPPAYKMHASNSPVKSETPRVSILETNLENQIENIYHANISLSRFGSEEKQKTSPSPAKKFPKVYIRKDLIQTKEKEKEETITLIKNMFSPVKSSQKSKSHLSNVLERSSEKFNLNGSVPAKSQNGYLDTSSVVKTLDFDSSSVKNERKNKKDGKRQRKDEVALSKSELFEMEAKSPYQVGDLAWARFGTYPFWPCLVTREPGSNMFAKRKMFGKTEHYIMHVTFLFDNGRRNWIIDSMLRKYQGLAEFENTRDGFTPEAKKKDPRLYQAFFISDKKLVPWHTSIEEAELLQKEPKRLRIDILNDLLGRNTIKLTPKNQNHSQKGGKITRTDSDVSLSESLYDTLFSDDDRKNDDLDRTRNKTRNKSLDVSEVVTACLDNMAAKTGMTKIQKQSHMDRWLQKAKSKTPEKSQFNIAVSVERVEKDTVAKTKDTKEKEKSSSSKKKKTPALRDTTVKIPYSLRKSTTESQNLLSHHNEHDYSKIDKIETTATQTDVTALDDDLIQSDNVICVIGKVESLRDNIESVDTDKDFNHQKDESAAPVEILITTEINDDQIVENSVTVQDDHKVGNSDIDQNTLTTEINDVTNAEKANTDQNVITIEAVTEAENLNTERDITPTETNNPNEIKNTDAEQNIVNTDCEAQNKIITTEAKHEKDVITVETDHHTEIENTDQNSVTIEINKDHKVENTDDRNIRHTEVTDDQALSDKTDQNVATIKTNNEHRADNANTVEDIISTDIHNDQGPIVVQEQVGKEINTKVNETTVIDETVSECVNQDLDEEDIESPIIDSPIGIRDDEQPTATQDAEDDYYDDDDEEEIESPMIDSPIGFDHPLLDSKGNVPEVAKNEESVHVPIKEQSSEKDKEIKEMGTNVQTLLDKDVSVVPKNTSLVDIIEDLNNVCKDISFPIDNNKIPKLATIENKLKENDALVTRTRSGRVVKKPKDIEAEDSLKMNSKERNVSESKHSKSTASLQHDKCLLNGYLEDKAKNHENFYEVPVINNEIPVPFIHYKKNDIAEVKHTQCDPDTVSIASDISNSSKLLPIISNVMSIAENSKELKNKDLLRMKQDASIEFDNESMSSMEDITLSELKIRSETAKAKTVRTNTEKSVSIDSMTSDNSSRSSRTLRLVLTDCILGPKESNYPILKGVRAKSVEEFRIAASKLNHSNTERRTLRSRKSSLPTDAKISRYIEVNDFHERKIETPDSLVKDDQPDTTSVAATSEKRTLRLRRSNLLIDAKMNKTIEVSDCDERNISSPDCLIKEVEPDTISIASTDSGASTKRKGKKSDQPKMDDPKFLKYLELRQDSVIDEHPELNQDEVIAYLYKTWQYEENLKSDQKKSDDVAQSNLVKGVNTDQKLSKKKTPSNKRMILTDFLTAQAKTSPENDRRSKKRKLRLRKSVPSTEVMVNGDVDSNLKRSTTDSPDVILVEQIGNSNKNLLERSGDKSSPETDRPVKKRKLHLNKTDSPLERIAKGVNSSHERNTDSPDVVVVGETSSTTLNRFEIAQDKTPHNDKSNSFKFVLRKSGSPTAKVNGEVTVNKSLVHEIHDTTEEFEIAAITSPKKDTNKLKLRLRKSSEGKVNGYVNVTDLHENRNDTSTSIRTDISAKPTVKSDVVLPKTTPKTTPKTHKSPKTKIMGNIEKYFIKKSPTTPDSTTSVHKDTEKIEMAQTPKSSRSTKKRRERSRESVSGIMTNGDAKVDDVLDRSTDSPDIPLSKYISANRTEEFEIAELKTTLESDKSLKIRIRKSSSPKEAKVDGEAEVKVDHEKNILADPEFVVKEVEPDTISINSTDSGASTKRKVKKAEYPKMEEPEFLKYLELRQDALMDEHPELHQPEIVAYLYKTWQYEENLKSEEKKNDEIEQSNLVKGVNGIQELPKKKKANKSNKVINIMKVMSTFNKHSPEYIKSEKRSPEDIKPDIKFRELPKRKSVQPFYKEDFSDIEDEIELFEIFKNNKKSAVKKEVKEEPIEATSNVSVDEPIKAETAVKTETAKYVDTKESVVIADEDYYDEEEAYFDQLTKPKPNVFKGLVREKVCEICEKTSNLVKCKSCNGMFHVDCVNKVVEVIEIPPPTRGRKKKNKKLRGRRPKVSTESNDESHSDDKTLDANVSEENVSVEEIKEPEIIVIDDVDTFEEQISVKMQEMIETTPTIDYDSFESDDGLDWDKTEAGKCEIVDVQLRRKEKPKVEDYSDFKCKSCQEHDTPICFVCKSAVSPKNKIEKRQKCQVAHCHKFFHLECLDHWPQTQFASGEPSRNNKKIDEHFEAITCPRHVCHTCVSDDPRGCKTRFSGDKLARCVRCPATYHSFTKCLPAGSQILSASHIVCPRHYEHRPGKVPCHVNTGWCFICALGGTLICCEYCPTSFHADCLNIEPPEGGYMCEDCETGRLPLYGEMVWVKLGHYRWWPGIILHPAEIPDNILAVKHTLGEFVVRFFGQYDHYWVNRGRVFPFQEGDSGKLSGQKSKIDEAFTIAMEHAKRAFDILKNVETNDEENQDIASSLLPPHYVKLKVNKPCGALYGKKIDIEESSLTQCECNPDVEDPCGPYSHCLNRMLLTECGPTCRAGERCLNRAFEQRRYPRLAPYRTPHRGWGLRTLEDIRAGQFVIEYVGELIDEAEFQRRMRRKHEMRDENYYFLTLDKERMIDAGPKGNLARFMNHCCEPNCETQKWTVLGDVRVGLFAIHDIPANTEVTFNYNLECAGIEKKQCMCGAKRCSGYIGAKPKQDDPQPKKQKRTYKKRKNTTESPSTSKPNAVKPKRPVGRPAKPRELTEIEKDLLIIKNATNGLSSDSEGCGERLNSLDGETKDANAKALKRKRVSFSTEETNSNSLSSPSEKRLKLDDEKSSEVGD